MNQWLASLAYLLGGMTLKWVLDLFFLRHVFRENEQRLSAREAEYTALKHEHSQALTELKNKLTELEATSRAKSLAEASLANLNSSQAALRAHALRVEEDLAAARVRETELLSRISEREQAVQAAEARALASESAVQHQAADAQVLRGRLGDAEAALSDLGRREAELGEELGRVRSELAERIRQADETARESEGARARVAELEVALQGRDAEIADARGRLTALESERESVSTTLRSTDRELGLAREQILGQDTALKEALAGAEASRAEAARAAADLESMRVTCEGLRQELVEARASGGGGHGFGMEPDPAWVHRVQDIQAELEAVSASHARLEMELATERELRTRLEGERPAAMPEPVAPPSAALLAEIDELNRERNALAAELAALKAASPSPGAPRRRKERAVEAELFPMLPSMDIDPARDLAVDEAIQPDPILDEPAAGEEA